MLHEKRDGIKKDISGLFHDILEIPQKITGENYIDCYRGKRQNGFKN